MDIGWKRCTWAILIDVAPILCKANSHSAANLLNCKFDASIFRIISHIVHIKVGSHSSALIHVSKILSGTAQHYPKVTQTSASKTPSAQMLSINMPSVWLIESRKPFQVKPAKQSPAHLPVTSGQVFGYPGVELTKSHGLEFIRWVLLEAWCDSPGNTGEPKNKPKIGALQNACPKFISRPQAQSSYKLVSYRMVGLEICQTCTYPTFPGKHPNLFSQPPKLRQHPDLHEASFLIYHNIA